MSIWDDEWEDYEFDKYDFEVWLDSINKSGDPKKDEEAYNEWLDEECNGRQSVEYTEWVITTPKYSMIISNN